MTIFFIFFLLSRAEGYGLPDAKERGVFNMGPAKAALAQATDEGSGKPVVKFDYSIPAGAAAGLWTKGYPSGLDASAANGVAVRVMTTDPDQLENLSVTLEIKGAKEVQSIPLRLRRGWSSLEEAVQWASIGSLKEVVFVVKPAAGAASAEGTLHFDLDFVKSPAISKREAARKALSPYDLLSAGGRGAFNIGPSEGTVNPSYDESLKKEVLSFEYKMPKGTMAGVWSKNYPSHLGGSSANAVRARVKTFSPKQIEQVTVDLEIKGSKEVQTVPLLLKIGWGSTEAPLNWDLIGSLKEAVFVVKPKGGRALSGKLGFDLDFIKADVRQRKAAPNGPFSFLDGSERGAFNIGASEGSLNLSSDPLLVKEVLKFDFSAPAGTVAGVWTKSYPPALSEKTANAADIRVSLPEKGLDGNPSVSLEIKGSNGIQAIPLKIQTGWNSFKEAVDWDRVGTLKEAVFVVKPEDGRSASGTLYFDLDFVKSDLPRKTEPSPFKNLGLLLGASLLLGALNFLIRKFLGGRAQINGHAESPPVYTFNLLDARHRGAFNVGNARGKIKRVFDDSLKKDVVKFDFNAPKGTIVGVWARKYPSEMDSDSINAVRLGVKVPLSTDPSRISAALEIKGSRDVQAIPLRLAPGWNRVQESIDWERIGDLREFVLAVKPEGDGKPASGTLYVDMDIIKLTHFCSLLDASDRGAFNIGKAEGKVERMFNEVLKKEVLKFDFKAQPETAVGIWARAYPSVLNESSAQAVKVGVFSPGQNGAREVHGALEIKGKAGMQTIPVPLNGGWNWVQSPVDWEGIGELNEVVFVVKPNGAPQAVSGTLLVDVDFVKPSPLEKAALIHDAFDDDEEADIEDSPFLKFRRDLAFGAATLLAASAALGIYAMGLRGLEERGWAPLLIAAAGALTAEILKFTLTRRNLTPLELFQDAFLTGLLAVTSTGQHLLQTPSSWLQVLSQSNVTAVLACLIYHGANASCLSSKGRHLRPASGVLIVAAPYLCGLVLALGNPALVGSLGNLLTAGVLSKFPQVTQTLGRLLALFLFNEVLANGTSLATKGRALKGLRTHFFLLVVSLLAVLSPVIADAGSSSNMAALPLPIRSVFSVLAAMASVGGLWAEAYLITGIILDGTFGKSPAWETLPGHVGAGFKKGAAFSAIFMALIYGLFMMTEAQYFLRLAGQFPVLLGALLGALFFPAAKAIIESFDGSQPFFERLQYTYTKKRFYLRGAVAGTALSWAIVQRAYLWPTPDRILYGLIAGLAASVGVDILRDILNAMKKQGRIQSWRVYLVDGFLAGFIGMALGFYLDYSQVPALMEKFKLYAGAGLPPQPYAIYPLLSKWGMMDLGNVAGGVRLFYNETLAGVASWAVAAWLFAINRAFIAAFFQKETTPIKFLFSKAGFEDLTRHMIYVLRWGLWMAPIINTGLRMMAEATWYNQDGAIRTLLAIYHKMALAPEDFQTWSLNLFIALLSYDFVRVLIWLDHMGLRVATLVNLSFIGMDKLDEALARFVGPRATQRYIPESIKRFTTWAPLLIPFYIPRGDAWDYAWSKSQAVQAASKEGGFFRWISSLPIWQMVLLAGGLSVVLAFLYHGMRMRKRRARLKTLGSYEISNRSYRVQVKENGGALSHVTTKGFDISRRSYDTLDPCGRVLYVVDQDQPETAPARAWPVIGNFPKKNFKPSVVERLEGGLRVLNSKNGIRTSVAVTLPDQDAPAEIWSIELQNLSEKPRKIKLVPYLEWVLDRPDADRGHTQYSRLFPEMEYAASSHAVFAWQKNTKSMGILASDAAPEGFLTARMDFIGRARSIWSPRILETLKFLPAQDTRSYPTFDPVGSLLLNVELEPRASKTLHILIGYAANRLEALELVNKHLQLPGNGAVIPAKAGIHQGPVIDPRLRGDDGRKIPLIGHGEIPQGTPQPYCEFSADGNRLKIKTPYTPRPFDHALSNAGGHYVSVTNRGLHTTSSGNSQQNRLTPDWPDTVTREIPGEAIYIYDVDDKEWFSPALHPLNQRDASNECEFGVDGTAVFRMKRASLSTEMTVFVPVDEPLGIYLLTIKNSSDREKTLRVSPLFQMVLAGQPEWSGPLRISADKDLKALLFDNPRNTFRSGPAFVSMSAPAEIMETSRGRFFGVDRGPDKPFLVEKGEPDLLENRDDRPVGALLSTIRIPAGGRETIAILLGQAEDRKTAGALIQKYKSVDAANATLKATRKWWESLMGTARLETSDPAFDHLQNWLKYQAIAERLWARRGFYQTSGAYGFRDQLQDSVNLLWADPAIARKQIVLHSAQQFLEGDVAHWFHALPDGRTAFSNRSHASDNLLWLAWAAGEYVQATGDESILDEMTAYLESENPFPPLPRYKHGWGSIYLRSSQEDTVYKHCMKAINLVLEKRMGGHGIPLIGTGDWNDGLDEIGSQGKGESIWLGLFLVYVLKNFLEIIEKKEGIEKRNHYASALSDLEAALERTWRQDRYLRAIHDDGTEIGIKDSGVWEIDALTAAWAVMSGINFERGETVFNTALKILEKENVILLGWPALREDTTPYLGRSSHYPEGVRENGMYCHGDQWLVKAARVLAEEFEKRGDAAKAKEYRAAAFRLWSKIAPLDHTEKEMEMYGGQPNKQAADMLTTYDQGRMIWNGYTGAAGWMFRQAFEALAGARLEKGQVILPKDLSEPRGSLKIKRITRDPAKSPFDKI